MQFLLSDLRLTIRQLLRRRGYAIAAVLTLGLALGATTAIFSVVSGVLLRPLPFPDPSRLITICERHPSVEGFCIASPPDVEDWSASATTVRNVGIARDWPIRLTLSDRAVPLYSGIATGGFFAALGVRPALGRLIAADEYGPEHRVAMLSHAAWQAHFGADPTVVGRTVSLDGQPATIVGVLSPSTDIPRLEGIDLWASLPFDPHSEENRGWRGFHTVARLAPGATRRAAAAELATIETRLGDAHPETNRGWRIEVVDLRDSLVGGVRSRLFVFLGAVGLVLLLGCANLANLMLARVTTRAPELAVRAAIGASRGRIARLLLLESLVVAIAGAVIGVLLASWGVTAFLAVAPPGIPRLNDVGVDWRVLLFALGLTVLTALLIGVAPAFRGARADLAGNLHASRVARGGGRGLLVVVETGIAVMLLAGAGLLGRTFARLTAWNPGFAHHELLVAWTGVSQGTYPTPAAVRSLYEQALEGVRSLPGVTSVSLTSGGALFGGEEPGTARAGGAGGDSTVVLWRDVGPAYFATIGLPLRAGREFTAADREGTEQVAVVNETLAARLWPGRSPIGQRLVMTRTAEAFTIVGVVADVPPFNPGAAVRPEVYWPYLQLTRWGAYFVVRTHGDRASLAGAVRKRLAEASPELDPSQVSLLDDVMARYLVSPRFNALLLSSFAGVALLLAAVGIAGLIAYRVSHRVREIGVRLALGASGGNVVAHFVREGGMLVVAGVAAGTVGAMGLTRFLRGMLSGTSPTDPVTFVAVTVGMLAIGFGAAWIPARRASRIDPIEALRAE
jgi:putative ABC transport system permease protein